MIFAAAAMIVLFAVYIGLLAMIGYGMWKSLPIPKLNVFMMIAGSLLLLFLVKPLFARSVRSKAPLTLRREHEPLLFAFVDRICQAVGAPVPAEIVVDENVNAAASYSNGLFGVLSNRLTLHIGMPLVVGLSMQQLAGVLAHEFGHFSQSVGMRLSWFVRVMNGWFASIVYQRDTWDEWLEQAADSSWRQLAGFAMVLQFLVWLSRKLLSLLMIAGHAVCSHLLREMEFDADRYEARLAGSGTFAETSKRLRVLGIAHEKSIDDLTEFFREGRLGDDLPRLIATNAGRLPKAIMTPLEDMIRNAKTHWLDSHPCDTDRINAANKEPAQGVFEYPGPAALLFTDPAGLSKLVTLAFYENVFEDEFDRTKLRTTDELLARQDDEERDSQALERFLFGRFTFVRPPCPPWDFDPGPGVAELAPQLQACRDVMLLEAANYNDALGTYVYNDTQISCFEQAERLCEAGVKFDPKEYRLQYASLEIARGARAQAAAQQSPLI
ncbi:MAG TPA: M48 family metallopeptidase, partial [Pirellulales bacterium]